MTYRRALVPGLVPLAFVVMAMGGCDVVEPPTGDDPIEQPDPNTDPPNDDPPQSTTVFLEVDGLVAVEAEHFFHDTSSETPRDWTATFTGSAPGATPDPDPPHVEGASGGTYLESLPDTRVTHDDPFEPGAIYNTPGDGPTLSYRVNFSTAGRYYVWVRAYSTGTEDNGIHTGIDDVWPTSGERIQWCSGKNNWTWSNAKRDSCGNACGCAGTIWIDVDEPGERVIRFAQREDGFEFDKFLMTTDVDYRPEGVGPEEVVR